MVINFLMGAGCDSSPTEVPYVAKKTHRDKNESIKTMHAMRAAFRGESK